MFFSLESHKIRQEELNYESLDHSQRNVSKSGRRVKETISYSKTKKISKFSSLKESKQTGTHARYAKYIANSFKENYSRRHSIDQFSSNGNNYAKKKIEDNSMQFMKPLKTSTVVCLAELNNIEDQDDTEIQENCAGSLKESCMQKPQEYPIYDKNKEMQGRDVNKISRVYENFSRENKTSIRNDNQVRRHSCNFSAVLKSKGIESKAIFSNFNQPVESDSNKYEKNVKIRKTPANKESNEASDSDTSVSSTNSSSSSSSTSISLTNFYFENDALSQDNDEIEGEREMKYTKDLKAYQICDSYISNNLISDDEQERQSQLKVMKEFERTLNFANNMTKVGYQSDSNSLYQLKHLMDTATSSFETKPFSKPQISLETLYYDDKVKLTSKCLMKESLIDTINSDFSKKSSSDTQWSHSNRAVNLQNTHQENASRHSTNELESKDKKHFTAIKEDNEYENGAASKGIPIKDDSKLFKKPSLLSVKNENNKLVSKKSLISNNNLKDFSINSNASSVVNNCPQESTPIYNCEQTATARRKYLLSKLDLNSTFRTGSMDKDKMLFSGKLDLIPEVSKGNTGNEIKQHQEENKKISKNSDLTNEMCANNNDIVNFKQDKVSNKPLNISQYITLNNASATSAFVVISKADVPKDLKKTLKEEFKKEKKNCIIQ